MYPLTYELIKKMWHLNTMEYYSAMKKDPRVFVGKGVHLETTTLTEINQIHKIKCYVVSRIREAQSINKEQNRR